MLRAIHAPKISMHCFVICRCNKLRILGLSLKGLRAVNFGLLYLTRPRKLVLVGSALDGFICSNEFLRPFGDVEACAKRGDVKAANQPG
jgi:hypothetical protein